MIRTHGLIGTGCLSVLFLGAGPVPAQQGSTPQVGGPVLTFGISSTLSATDNYNLDPNNSDSAVLFDHRLSFGYENRRAIDTLRFDLDGVVRAIDAPGSGSRTIDDGTARLSYDREGTNSRFRTSAEYNLTSVNFLDPFDNNRFFADDPLDETDLKLDDRGEREQIATRFSFETGINDPLGFIVDGRYRERNYSDTTDPDLFDTRVLNVNGTTRFTLGPKTRARVALRYEDYSADDAPQTDRQTSSISLGLTQALSKIDTLDVSLGYQDIETDETILGVRQTDDDTGIIGSAALTRELTRGTIGTSFDLRESVNGQTATWLVNRALTLPRGAIEISLGATSDVSDTIRPVGSFNFTHEMKRSSLTARVERQVTTSTRSNELRVTRASVDYRYEINSLSDLSLTANFAELARSGGPEVNDTIRADLRATYSREITRDWRLSSGYEYRVRDEDNNGSATSNRIFLTLERGFVFRP
ncbi:MAG: hypothetical protein H5U19_04880 [Rhodobacteraceae bacterium]|nr:hypothetical protein [Paracoccaceae bacterium]